LRRREKQLVAEGSGLKTSAPPPPRQTQEVSDLPVSAFGRLRRAVPLGQGVGGRVDAASPVLRNGRHVGCACSVGLQSIRKPLERAELTVERAKICAPKRPQTQITALGIAPNAVIGEP